MWHRGKNVSLICSDHWALILEELHSVSIAVLLAIAVNARLVLSSSVPLKN